MRKEQSDAHTWVESSWSESLAHTTSLARISTHKLELLVDGYGQDRKTRDRVEVSCAVNPSQRKLAKTDSRGSTEHYL